DLLAAQRRAGGVAPGRVADLRREVADHEDDLVPELLELAHLLHEHGVPEVEVGAGRVEARLHAERPALAELREELVLALEVDDALGQGPELLSRVAHGGAGEVAARPRRFKARRRPRRRRTRRRR